MSDQEIDLLIPSSIEGTDWVFRLRKSGNNRMRKSGANIAYKEDWLAHDGQTLEWVFGLAGDLKK